MTDELVPQPDTGNGSPEGEHHHHGHKKHRAKVRAAWIAFIGRIIAQISGAAATIVIGLAVVGHYGLSRANPSPPDGSGDRPAVNGSPDAIDLVVLPFDRLSPHPQDFLADAISDSLIVRLGRIESLHVISRTTSMQYKGAAKSVPQIAADLGVDFVVEGTVMVEAGGVRVTVRLIDAATDRELWARRYEQDAGDVLALEATLSAAIAREITGTIPASAERPVSGTPRIVRAAYDHYIRGRGETRSRTLSGLQSAVRHFEEAIRLEPTFAPAHAALATAQILLAGRALSSRPESSLEQAREAAARALAADPNLAEAHLALAAVADQLDWNWPAADATYRRAIGLGPDDPLAHEWYAKFLAEQGRHREALGEAELTVELDPLLADAHARLALVHYYAGRFDRAAAAARRALELRPEISPARLILAWSLLESGDSAGAITACNARSWPAGVDDMLAVLADAHRRRGALNRANEIRAELLGLGAPSPSARIRVHISRHEYDAAFALLDQALDLRSSAARALKVDPVFAPLRRDARFSRLVERLRLWSDQ